MQIQIYGDSLMRGVLVDEKYHYRPMAKTLLAQLQNDTGAQAVSRAHFGYTAAKGQEVLQRDLAQGLNCQMALLEFGGNDCDHDWHQVAAHPEVEHLPKVSLQNFLETLRSMVQSLLDHNIQPILMTLPPLDAQKYLDFISHLGCDSGAILRWLGDVQMIYRWQELYSNAISRLADQLNLPLLDVRNRFLSRRDCTQLIARDGIHLTEAGYRLVFDALRDQILAIC